jgi:two-component system chemotaxis response regulator CheB
MFSQSDGRQDIIVIGASAGGVAALQRLVGALTEDLRAAVLVVLHRPPEYPSLLSQLLGRAGRLPAADAEDGEPVRPGRIVVAPPDRHLLVEDGRLRVTRGPKENHSRPAIDPLFRSAAREFGPRVAGVILSGTLFDGTAGLWEVKRRGGVAVVQDPAEAAFPGMPESALANVEVDHVLPVGEIAPLLARLAGNPARRNEVADAMSSSPSQPSEFEELPDAASRDQDEQVRGERHGRTSVFTCPDCGGTLWQADAGSVVQFRCHVGHAYTGESMVREQGEALERSLWYGVRTFTDHALLSRQLAEHARGRGDDETARRYEERSAAAERHAQTLREILGPNGSRAAPLAADGGGGAS